MFTTIIASSTTILRLSSNLRITHSENCSIVKKLRTAGLNPHFTMHIALCTLHYVHNTMHIAIITLHFAHCSMHIKPCRLYYAYCIMHFALFTWYYALFELISLKSIHPGKMEANKTRPRQDCLKSFQPR